MTALASEADRGISGSKYGRLPSEISANPYAGSALSWAADGYVRELVAGEPFAGFARVTVQTKDAAAADGDRFIEAHVGEFDAILSVSGAAQDDVAHGRLVYASDDDTFTFTAAGNTLVGAVIGLEASGKAIVRCRTWAYGHARSGEGKIYALSAAATLTTQHLGGTIYADTQAGAFTLTLPAAADCTGRRLTFVRTGTGTNALTLDGASSENVDGSATLATLDAARDTVTIESDGSNWYIVAARIA